MEAWVQSPTQHHALKDPALPQVWHKSQLPLRFNPWPINFCMRWVQPLKKKRLRSFYFTISGSGIWQVSAGQFFCSMGIYSAGSSAGDEKSTMKSQISLWRAFLSLSLVSWKSSMVAGIQKRTSQVEKLEAADRLKLSLGRSLIRHSIGQAPGPVQIQGGDKQTLPIHGSTKALL